jgi:hypothetical protein
MTMSVGMLELADRCRSFDDLTANRTSNADPRSQIRLVIAVVHDL